MGNQQGPSIPPISEFEKYYVAQVLNTNKIVINVYIENELKQFVIHIKGVQAFNLRSSDEFEQNTANEGVKVLKAKIHKKNVQIRNLEVANGKLYADVRVDYIDLRDFLVNKGYAPPPPPTYP